MMTNTDLLVQYYNDTLIIETVLAEPHLTKQASGDLVSGLVSKVKDYIAGKIDPNDKVGSVINILTPGLLVALGHPVLAFIVKLAQMFLGFDVAGIVRSAADKVKSWITSGKQLSPNQVSSIVEDAVKEHAGSEPTENDLEKFKLSSITLQDARIFKLALMDIQNNISLDDLEHYQLLHKNAAGFLSPILRLIGLRSNTAGILGKVIYWIFTTVLASAGFMIGGDILQGIIGGSDSQKPSPSNEPSISLSQPRQTTFKQNPAYTEEQFNINSGWIEAVPPNQIGSQIVDWATFIYPDLKSKENEIPSTIGFKTAVNKIMEYNATNTSTITFMPKIFTSRKKVVDLFIDELAQKYKTTPFMAQPAKKPALEIGYK